jgi:hypothetical protein
MGACLQSAHYFKQNITGGAFEALAPATGDSLSIPNYDPGTSAWLLEVWAGNSANTGEYDIRSPFFHDNTRGLRLDAMFNPTLSGADGDPQMLMGYHVRQPLYPSDTLIVEVNATATNNVGLGTLMYFESLRGADQRLARWEEIEPRIVNMVGVRVAVTAGAAGDYGTAVALNASDDRLRANVDYALLGITSQLPCCSIAVTGPETSGRKIALPLHWLQDKAADWFVDIAQKYHIPAIPIFNANNRGNITFQAADPGGAIATLATVQLAQLSP